MKADRIKMRLLILIVLLCVPCVARAQKEEPEGQSIISGRVLYADTGRPARRASVALYSNLNHRPVRSTPSNQRGEFRFSQVAPGSYFVVAQTPGVLHILSSFALTEFGLGGGNIGPEQVRVTVDGKNTARCEVRVVRAGTIKGTMTYSDKEPVVNARVKLFRRQAGAIVPFFTQDTRTNDRGMYRIDGLPDGEYFVAAVVGKSTNESANPRAQKGILSSYYPGVRNLAEAKSVQVQSASEVTGVDFTFGDEERGVIWGVIKWRNGMPARQATVTLQPKGEPEASFLFSSMFRALTASHNSENTMMRDIALMETVVPMNQETTERGEWAFDDLPLGTYVVTAYAKPEKPLHPVKPGELPQAESYSPRYDDDRFVSGQVEVTLGEEDKQITIELSDGASILGSVSMVDGSTPPPIMVRVAREGSFDFLFELPQRSDSAGNFVLPGVMPGDVRLEADLYGKDDIYLTSITLGSQDLMRESLRLTDGVEVSGVRVTLAKGMATLKGGVQVKEDGSPAGGAGIFLIRSDPRLQHLDTSRVYTTADPNGLFELKCPPGDYLLFTWTAGGQPLQPIRDFVISQGATARRISLQSKEEKQIELTISKPRK